MIFIYFVLGAWSCFQYLLAGRAWYLAVNKPNKTYGALGQFLFFLLFITAPVLVPIALSYESFIDMFMDRK